ncbi:sugar transferase [Actinospongicola halichondriae]|uniref:sugar transferase n=1 Tax=Actinospongicola halichondriae TaxID=3236844 RepID=UPI003D41184B
MKRGIDLVLAVVGSIMLLPVFVVVAVLVRIRLGSPVLFRQQRAGLAGRPFELVKFRSMNDDRSVTGELLSDADRITPFGRWLRSTSLDELPELWLVVGGAMSVIGPRPLPVSYLDRYTPEQARRHEVKPGITGWAQVNGRNTVDWNERLAMDVWYVDNRSLWLDLQILWRTVTVVARRDGVSAQGEATMHELPPRSTGDDS